MATKVGSYDNDAAALRDFEKYAGIKAFVSELEGFNGIQKQRFSDFIVEEVVKEGGEKRVVRLESQDYEKLERESFPIQKIAAPPEDFNVKALFTDVVKLMGSEAETALSTEFSQFLESCRNKDKQCLKTFVTGLSSNDKETRKSLHNVFKKHAGAFVESGTTKVDGEGGTMITLTAKHMIGQRENKEAMWRSKSQDNQWPEELGEYLRFTLLKEKIDTMSAVKEMTRALGGRVTIDFAGTKDKRGTTSQWCTIHKMRPSVLDRHFGRFNPRGPAVRTGDYCFVKEKINLGDLYGNRFGIVLRELDKDVATISKACEAVKNNGFINYYGLQRFGKGDFGAKSCDLGREIFRGNFKHAVDLLFVVSPDIDDEDCKKAKAIYMERDYKRLLKELPRAMNGAERAAVTMLKDDPQDFERAFKNIPKKTRLLYLHSYQSLIWNTAASKRVEMGLEVMVGDLVVNRSGVLDGAELSLGPDAEENGGEGEGEGQGQGQEEREGEISEQRTQIFGAEDDVIHEVTAEDVATGRFSLRDVVLPVVGTKVKFPSHSMKQLYTELLEGDGLSLETFGKGEKQYRMSGAYRRLLQFPEDMDYTFVGYHDLDEDIVSTKFVEEKSSRKRGRDPSSGDRNKPPKGVILLTAPKVTPKPAPAPAAPPKKALKMSFTLPAGAYATMMFREMTRASTDTGYQARLTAVAAAARAQEEEGRERKNARNH